MSSTDSVGQIVSSVHDLQADRAHALGDRLKNRSSENDARIAKAAKEFEAILLSQWVQDAQRCFASVPGGDSDEGGMPGKDAYQGMGSQAIAGALAASGGIGIARMIVEYFKHNNNDMSISGPDAPDSQLPQENSRK